MTFLAELGIGKIMSQADTRVTISDNQCSLLSADLPFMKENHSFPTGIMASRVHPQQTGWFSIIM